MATGDQIKALIKAHYDQDNDRFKTAALRIAASETRSGHTTLGREITAMVDASSRTKGNIINLANKDNLFLVSFPETRLSDLIVSPEITEKINRVLTEYRQRKKLASFGLSCRRRLLLEGEPGTGKTMTASVIAAELVLPLFIVQTDKLITKYLGETSTRLRRFSRRLPKTEPSTYLTSSMPSVRTVAGTTRSVRCAASSTRSCSSLRRTPPKASSSQQRTIGKCSTKRSSGALTMSCITSFPP